MPESPDNIVPITSDARSAAEKFSTEHDRELLTILFTDLVDSTKLQSGLGNVEAAQLGTDYLNAGPRTGRAGRVRWNRFVCERLHGSPRCESWRGTSRARGTKRGSIDRFPLQM